MKYKYLISALGLAFSLNTQASLVDLSGQGYVTYGDFNSYSLPIAGLDVASPPGIIKDLIVVATGSNGGPVTTNFAGMDNAYATPSGVSGSNYFDTSQASDPDPDEISSFFGDQETTWDTSLAALQSFLNGEDMVFFFNNNNLNGANLQSLAAWAQVEVRDAMGDRLGIFDFTNNGGAYALVSEGGGGTFAGDPTAYTSTGSGPLIGDNAGTDYVLAGGPICIDTDTTPPTPVSCSNPDSDEGPINHNLGADDAAYAVVAPELNMLLKDLFDSGADISDYTMSIELHLGCDPLFGGSANDEICTGELSGFGKNINNGYEQLFIGTGILDPSTPPPPTPMPNPSILFLMATGILLLRRRK